MRNPKHRHEGVWAVLLVPILLLLFLPAPVMALSIYTDANPPQADIPSTGTVDGPTEASRIRKLADYIQDTYQVRRERASIIVSEAINSGAQHDLEPELILAVIAVESTFKERAVSPKGARGLMQILPRSHPDTVEDIGGAHALFDPRKNIYAGSRILVSYLDRSKGNVHKALLRYNGSYGDPRSGYARKVLGVYQKLKKLDDQEARNTKTDEELG